jgi:thiol:disulfide interchange protein
MIRPSATRRRLLAFGAAWALAGPAFAAEPPSALPTDFDPARDPGRDLEVALRIAHAAGRRVLIEVGGEWCSQCHALERFFEANPDLRRYRDRNYVWLKVNWSPENTNQAFLHRYPPVSGYPHFFVLDGRGRLAHSQAAREFEADKSYDPAAMHAFLVKWAPRR